MGYQVTCARCAEPHVQTDYCEDPKDVNVSLGADLTLPLYYPNKMVTGSGSQTRTFSSGATRDSDHGKLDFEGFLSPLALQEFAKYMHENRVQSDGTLRASDNWQKGIPVEVYMKSMWRHFFAVWSVYREDRAGSLRVGAGDEEIRNLCALMFNVQGMLHELVKLRDA